MSKNVPYKWTDEHQKNFDAIKRVIGQEVSLACIQTLINAPFQTHTDASCAKTGNQLHFIPEK
jgi:hypothetical protein